MPLIPILVLEIKTGFTLILSIILQILSVSSNKYRGTVEVGSERLIAFCFTIIEIGKQKAIRRFLAGLLHDSVQTSL